VSLLRQGAKQFVYKKQHTGLRTVEQEIEIDAVRLQTQPLRIRRNQPEIDR
jgi:hypothetical protein